MEDYYSIILDILQIVALTSSAIFGIFGLFTEYRDDDGKITKGGVIASIGIVLGGSLAVVTHILQSQLDSAAAAELRETQKSAEDERERQFQQQMRVLRVSLQKTSSLSQLMSDNLQQTGIISNQTNAALVSLETMYGLAEKTSNSQIRSLAQINNLNERDRRRRLDLQTLAEMRITCRSPNSPVSRLKPQRMLIYNVGAEIKICANGDGVSFKMLPLQESKISYIGAYEWKEVISFVPTTLPDGVSDFVRTNGAKVNVEVEGRAPDAFKWLVTNVPDLADAGINAVKSDAELEIEPILDWRKMQKINCFSSIMTMIGGVTVSDGNLWNQGEIYAYTSEQQNGGLNLESFDRFFVTFPNRVAKENGEYENYFEAF